MTEAAYKKYLLVLLIVLYGFNAADRLALGMVLQEIKVDLSLSDTQLGVITGIAFALFYSVIGLPLARWADRGNRVTIITMTTALWSAAVALCGAAVHFIQLVLVRIAVAVGEAGFQPVANSLIADHFARADRPRASARFMLGGPMSFVIGYFLAGWLNELYGWRMTFVLLGVPGFVLAALAWKTMREPRLDAPVSQYAEVDSAPSMKDVFLTLIGNATFRHLIVALSVASFFGIGIQQWKPAFFIRSFGVQTGELGTWFALIYGIGGFIGMYFGGEWASRHAANNEPLQLRVAALAYASFGAVSTATYLASNKYLAFGLLGLGIVGISTAAGPMYATLQTLVPSRMRAVSIALVFLSANLIGSGLGPLAAGALSDAFRPWAAEQSLRYALLALCPGYLWTGWHLWRASKTVARDVQASHAVKHPPKIEARSLGTAS